MSDQDTTAESRYVVTLDDPIRIPERTTVFTARDRSVEDRFTQFIGVDYADGDYIVEVHNDSIRSVAHLAGEDVSELDDRQYD